MFGDRYNKKFYDPVLMALMPLSLPCHKFASRHFDVTDCRILKDKGRRVHSLAWSSYQGS